MNATTGFPPPILYPKRSLSFEACSSQSIDFGNTFSRDNYCPSFVCTFAFVCCMPLFDSQRPSTASSS